MESSEENLKTASSRSEEDDRLYYQKKLDSTMHSISYLNHKTQNKLEYKGILKVGLLAYPPSIGIQNFEDEKDHKKCAVEMYSHHIGWGEPPNFTLSNRLDNEWYSYFTKQFDAMWDKSRKLDLDLFRR